MKPVYILFMILIITSTMVEARIYKPTIREQINSQAITLKAGSLNETIGNVLDFVGNNITYKFHWYPQNVDDIWRTKEGDCTDQATLAKYILEQIYYRNNTLRFKIVHGYCDGMKHDWLRMGKEDIDNFGCYERQYMGERAW